MSTVTLDRPWLEFDLGQEMQVLSWAVHRPGLVRARRILWRAVRNADLPKDLDVENWLAGALQARGAGDAVTFLTSCDIRDFTQATAIVGVTKAHTIATVSLSNAERVGHRVDRSGQNWGTINVALRLNRCLTDTALLEAQAAMHRRDVLTELGPDDVAIRAEDRDAVLFDMGLAQPQVDFCIRTADPALLTVLRAHAGRSLFESETSAMSAVLRAHPHRIALTRLGRVEVYQMIGGPDTGGTSPEGPHTHVLPKLLRAERTRSANTPIPAGWIPCAGFHPKNPVMGRLGENKAFDQDAFDAFQDLLKEWGPIEYITQKMDVWTALGASTKPESWIEPRTRMARAGLRNAIRQWRRQHGDSDLLTAWARSFDKGEADTDAENPEH